MRFFSRTIFLAAIILTTAASTGQIVPTADPGSDCVAAKIYADRSERNLKYDKLYCSVNKDSGAYDRCLQNTSSEQAIVFFTDRCNAPEEGAYVSFNGITHTVLWQSGSRHPDVGYAGTWEGDNVEVRIVPRKLIERFEEDRVTYSVDVIITSGGSSVTIPAIYDNRL
jgi:hypothetical protein